MAKSLKLLRAFISLGLGTILCTTVSRGAEQAVVAARPNVVVFLVDDMGVMDTSLPFLTDESGKPKTYPLNEYYRTPSMERLASQGIRFNQFYAMSVCSPTRISIMTGQNAARHRTTNWINPTNDNRGPNGPADWDWKGLDKEDVTLPGLLSKAGYQTVHIGKGHFGPTDSPGAEPLNLGFGINVAGASFGAPGSYLASKDYGWATKRKHHAVPHLEKYHGSETFLTEALTLEAKEILSKAADSEQPFYLYMSHYAVHAPFDSDERFAANYANSGKPKSAQAFATLIEGMDKSLGDILDHLEQIGEAENTLVFFLGDNGSDAPLGHQHEVACAAPLRGKKGAHYEGGMRVPFIAAWAKANPTSELQRHIPIPHGTLEPSVANVCDLFSTVLEATRVEKPPTHTVDGRSLVPLLTGSSDKPNPQQFLMHYPHAPHRSNYFTVWRDGDWKAIYHALPEVKAKGAASQSNGQHFQLFNLAEDPFESKDLSKERPEVLKRMVQEMARQLELHGAVYPVDGNGNELRPVLP